MANQKIASCTSFIKRNGDAPLSVVERVFVGKPIEFVLPWLEQNDLSFGNLWNVVSNLPKIVTNALIGI